MSNQNIPISNLPVGGPVSDNDQFVVVQTPGAATVKKTAKQLRDYYVAVGNPGPKGDPGPSGPSGNAQNITTVAAFNAASFDAVTKVVNIQGYYSVGVGGMRVRRVNSQPSHPWKFRSTDRYKADGSTDNTLGGWWEGYSETGFVTPEQFGAHADGVTDDHTPIANAIAYANSVNIDGAITTSTPVSVFFPSSSYYSSQTITLAQSIKLHGQQVGGLAGSAGYCTIWFPVDVTGIYIVGQGHTTVALEYLCINGVNGSGTAHGIEAKGPFDIRNCKILQFSSNGINMDGTTAPGLNLDGSTMDNVCIGYTGLHGVYCAGADANICVFSNVAFERIGGSNIIEVQTFGNTWISPNFAGNGGQGYQTRAGVQGCCVKGSDNNYYQVAAPGQVALAPTTDPVTDVGGVVWKRLANIPAFSIPTWVNGTTYSFGAMYFIASNTLLEQVYVEVGYSPDPIVAVPDATRVPLLVTGGESQQNSFDGYTLPSVQSYGAYVQVNGPLRSFRTKNPRTAGSFWESYTTLGGTLDEGTDIIASVYGKNNISFLLTYEDYRGIYYVKEGYGGNNYYPFGLTTPATNNNFSARIPPNPVSWHPNGLLLGANGDVASLVTWAALSGSPPTASGGVASDICLTQGRDNNSPAFWVLTFNTTANANVWVPVIAAPTNQVFRTVATAPTANVLDLTGANISGGMVKVVLNLSANLGANASAHLPTVADLVAAINGSYANVAYYGQTFELVIANTSAGAFQWTVTTNTGWTLNGTMTVAQNTWRKFFVTLNTLTTATLQATGETGTYT